MRGQGADGNFQRYTYNAANRLVKVTDDVNGYQAEYIYGGNNQRLVEITSAVTTYYACDGGQVVAEYRPDGTGTSLQWQKSYVYLGSRLLATESSGSSFQLHHPDRLGTRLVTNRADGSVVSEQIGLPFGTEVPGTLLNGSESYGTNQSNRRFTSYDRSSVTKLDYAVNRYYNAGLGRFTQVDPIGMEAAALSDPQSLNLYAYCGNDPINHLDPDGLFFGKLFRAIGKAFKFIFKVAAIALFVVAMILLPTMLVAGGFWLSSGAWFGWGSWFGLMGAAGAAGLAGWHNGTLGRIAGAFLTTLGKSGNFRTPSTFPNGTGVSGVNSFLAIQQRKSPSRKILKLVQNIGGAFSKADQDRVRAIRATVFHALETRPECAALFGGYDRATKLLAQAEVLFSGTLNPGYNGTGVNNVIRAINDDAEGRFAALSEVGGKRIFLHAAFFEYEGATISNQATIFLHELRHNGGFGPEPDGYDYKAEYRRISDKCGTAYPF